jgi:hypothetical protein
MNPKPPTRTGRSGWLGHRATRLKSLAVVGAVTLGFAGAAIAASAPASADPAFSFIQVGSDTTEFVMDSFANQVGGGVLGTYDAVNPLSQIAGETITPQLASSTVAGAYTSCSFTRPNGSGGGFKAMAYAYTVGSAAGTTTLGQTGTPPQAGCISLSRSSSPPGSVSATAGTPGSLLTTGNFVYIPFAVDAVTYATGPATATSETIQCVSTTSGCTNVSGGIGTITFTTTPTTIPQNLDLTLAQLQTLYTNCASVTVGSTTLNPGTQFSYTSTAASPAVFTTATASNLTANQVVTLSGTAPTGFTAGTPYFVISPTSTTFELAATSGGTAIAGTSVGSGTVVVPGNVDLYAPQAGSGTLAYWELTMGVSAPQACWHQTIIAGPGIGIAVEEHDGSAFASDPDGIGPISAGRWVAASTGADPDLRHGDVLQSVTATNGTVVTPLNAAGTAINVAGCLSGSSFSQATCFPLIRELYNVMDYYEVVNTTPPAGSANNPAFNSVLSSLFAGTGSSLCQSTFTIKAQGFAPIATNSSFNDLCGATTSGLRVQMNNSASAG